MYFSQNAAMQVDLGDVGLTRALATDILYQLYHALSFCVVADVNVVSKIYATICCFVVPTDEVATPTLPSPDGAPKVGVHSFSNACNMICTCIYIYVLLLSLVRNLVHAFLVTLCHQDFCGI